VEAADAAEAGATGNRFNRSKLLSEAARLGAFSTGMSRRIPFAENLALLISHFNFQRSFSRVASRRSREGRSIAAARNQPPGGTVTAM